jgi:hypothetical protein
MKKHESRRRVATASPRKGEGERRRGSPRREEAKPARARAGAFTLRFALEGVPPQAVHADPRVEALRRQLAALLDLVVLTKNGQTVEVDGFKLVAQLREPGAETYRIFAEQ